MLSGRFWTLFAILGTASVASAQQPVPDSTSYLRVRLDSSEIRQLPLSRSLEIPSFLPGTTIGLDYGNSYRGLIGSEDLRVDGVPVGNFTFGNSFFQLPTFAIASVDARLSGNSAAYANTASVRYNTVRGGEQWQGFARARTDDGLPGSIGNLAVEAGVNGALARIIRLSGQISTQSSLRTEFNNYGNEPIYGVTGVDTTISYDPISNGDVRMVPVAGFAPLAHDVVPGSGWNERLGHLRVDLMPSSNTDIFFTGTFAGVQQRAAFGGGCAPCAIFDPMAQRGSRSTTSVFAFGVDQKLAGGSLEVRLAHSADEIIDGVLTPQTVADQDARGIGIDQSSYEFLVDDDSYPIDDALIARILNNPLPATPFPTFRTDLALSLEYRANPYGAFTYFANRGIVNGDYRFAEESRRYGSTAWHRAIGASRVLIGAEATAIAARYVTVGYINSNTLRVWKEAPSLVSAYVEDALTLGTMLVDAGIRFDSYNPNTTFAATPGYNHDNFLNAARRNAVSPRLSFRVPRGAFALRGTAGRYHNVPTLNQQFSTKNIDYFRFHNTNTNTVFSQALELVTVDAVEIGGAYHTRRAEFNVDVFQNRTTNAIGNSLHEYTDPTNPGSSTFLRVTGNTITLKSSGVAGTASTNVSAHSVLQLGVTRERTDAQATVSAFPPGSVDPTVTTLSSTSIVALAEVHGLENLGGIDATLSLRARSPVDYGEVSSNWITRFDGRLSKRVDMGGVHGTLWVDGLRLLGSSMFLDDNPDISFLILAHRQTLGGGSPLDNINLTSMAKTSPGVRNAVDLYYLQQAEKRFGNGDLIFTAAEQEGAFGAAERLRLLAAQPLSQSRRIQAGLQLGF